MPLVLSYRKFDPTLKLICMYINPKPIHAHRPYLTLCSRQQQEQLDQLQRVRRAQTSHRVPSGSSSESGCAATHVPSRRDIVQDIRMSVEGGVDESDRALANIGSRLVDDGEDGAEGWR